ncbi:MAG: TRIC cation channel family protein [Nitrososphaera sp.]
MKFDAIGLGVFTIIGATFAYNLVGLNFLARTFSGLITAIGGVGYTLRCVCKRNTNSVC